MNTMREYSKISLKRAMRWHRGGLSEWSVTDWSNALAGEVGELCNAVKKFRRVEDALQQHDGDTPAPKTRDEAIRAIAKEIGDVYAYLDLTAQRFGLDLWSCARDTFNFISKRERLPECMPNDFDDGAAELHARLERIEKAAELIATDRDFVVHCNHVTDEAIEEIMLACGRERSSW